MNELDVNILASAEEVCEGFGAVDGTVTSADATERDGEPFAASPFACTDRLLDKLADGTEELLHLLRMCRHEVPNGSITSRKFAEGRIVMRIRQAAAVEDETFDIFRQSMPIRKTSDDDLHIRGGS